MLMTDGIIDPSRKARRRAAAAWTSRLIWLLIMAAALYAAFRFGGEQNRAALDRLTDAHIRLTNDLTAEKSRTVDLTARSETARRQLDELTVRYEQNVPKGDLAALTAMSAQRLKDGVPLERLAFVLENVAAKGNCTPLETRSMVVTTPLVRGRAVNVSYEGGQLTISGTGQSAQGENGSPESWYDPAVNVTMRLVPLGGDEIVLTGKLPLQQTVVAGAASLNFLIAEGDRGRVTITGERCAFP